MNRSITLSVAAAYKEECGSTTYSFEGTNCFQTKDKSRTIKMFSNKT